MGKCTQATPRGIVIQFSTEQGMLEDLYSPRNDPDPEMILKLTHKWCRPEMIPNFFCVHPEINPN